MIYDDYPLPGGHPPRQEIALLRAGRVKPSFGYVDKNGLGGPNNPQKPGPKPEAK